MQVSQKNERFYCCFSGQLQHMQIKSTGGRIGQNVLVFLRKDGSAAGRSRETKQKKLVALYEKSKIQG